ncbi:MAG: DUF429 domain-containing protein [Candidatus Bipolaricaulaceae bacterium]
MKFVGIDLAWSAANPSAAVLLRKEGEGGVLEAWHDRLGADEAILEFVRQGVGEEPALIAVDAPLLVPNEEGTRPCDRELSRFYRWAQAQAYPANRRRLGPRVRGEELVRLLEGLGFRHDPEVPAQRAVRQVVEVFPHPAAVELFGLPRILRYKARPGRSYAERWAELERFRELLAGLAGRRPALHAAALLGQARPQGRRGQALKRLEDLLDALFCAYIALHLWYWGPRGYRRFGDRRSGYILVPILPG